MRFSLFSKSKKKIREEKDHREPIMVRIFREDSDHAATVTFTEDGDSSPDAEGADSIDESIYHRHLKFIPDQKYFNISVYAIVSVIILMLVAVLIFNFTSVKAGIKNFFKVMSPFLVGALVAFIVSPIVNWLDDGFFEKVCKIKKPKVRLILAIVITYAFLLGLLTLAFRVLVPEIINSLSELLARSMKLYSALSEFFSSLQDRFPMIDFNYISLQLSNLVPNLLTAASEWVRSSIPKVFTASYAIFKGVVNFLLMLCISVYMVCDRRRIARGATELVYAFVKPSKASSVVKTFRESEQIFFGFIIGKSIDSIIIGMLCFIILSIIHFPYAVLVSVIVGVTNMIPFFGPFIGAAPGILLYLCIEPIYAVVFALIIFGLQQFDGWFLGPMILGDSTGIRPLWVIVGITLGGAYFGVVGMFLGVPCTAVIVYLLDIALHKRLAKRKIEIS